MILGSWNIRKRLNYICCMLIGNKKQLEDQRTIKYEERKLLAHKNRLILLLDLNIWKIIAMKKLKYIS